MGLSMNDAIGWHTSIAESFDAKYTNNPTFKKRYRLWKKLIQRYSLAHGRALDFGCGSGALTFSAADFNREVIGIDGSKSMLDLCNKKKESLDVCNINFVQSRLEVVDTDALGVFDLVFCSSVLEYMDDFWKTFITIQSLLKKNGILIFSIPNSESIYRYFERCMYSLTGRPRYYAYVNNLFAKKKLLVEVQKLDMDIVQSGYYAPTPILSSLFRKIGKEAYSDNLLYLVCKKIS